MNYRSADFDDAAIHAMRDVEASQLSLLASSCVH